MCVCTSSDLSTQGPDDVVGPHPAIAVPVRPPFGQTHAVFIIDNDNLTFGDQSLIGPDFKCFTGQFREFDDRTLTEPQQIVDDHLGPAELHSDFQRDVEKKLHSRCCRLWPFDV